MRVSRKRYIVARFYNNSTYIDKARKIEIIPDLEIMGVTVDQHLDEATIRDIARVVSKHIYENGVSR